jgi:hypothetical protein
MVTTTWSTPTVDYDRIAPSSPDVENFNEEGRGSVTESESARPEAPGADTGGSLSPNWPNRGRKKKSQVG